MESKVDIITPAEYGSLLFTNLLKEEIPDEWKAIENEALPLVKKLLELQSQIPDCSFKVVNEEDKDRLDNELLITNMARALQAQATLWVVDAQELSYGDYIWYNGEGFSIYVMEDEPLKVLTVNKSVVKCVSVYGDLMLLKIKHSYFLRAPADWNTFKESYYRKLEYWVEEADKLELEIG